MYEQQKTEFNEARKIYPGVKRGNEIEFSNFIKKFKNWKEILPSLEPAIIKQIAHKKRLKAQNKFCPEWPHFRKWINQSYFEMELPSEPKRENPLCACGCGSRGQFSVDGQWFAMRKCQIKILGW